MVFLEVVLLRVSHTDFLFTRPIAFGYAKLQSLSPLPIYIITDISLSPGTAETKPVCLIGGSSHPERVNSEMFSASEWLGASLRYDQQY